MNDVRKKLQEVLGSRWILVVEPSVNYKMSIKQFLANLKFKHVKIVSSVRDARRFMLSNNVGMFIVEWNLENKNGLQFCRELHKETKYREMPFLLMSTDNQQQDVVLASETGVNGYLLKPFSFEVFVQQIDKVLATVNAQNSEKFLLDIADQFLEKAMIKEAKEYFEQALAFRPESARALAGYARLLLEIGHAELAMEKLQEAVRQNPQYISAYQIMLAIYKDRKNLQGQLVMALKLNEMSPDNPKYSLTAAEIYLHLGEYEKSEVFFRRTIRISPKVADAFKGLGDLYMVQEEYDKAMENYRKALDLDSEDVSTLNSLGLAYVKKDKIKEGISYYRVALRIEPDNPKIIFNLAYAYEKSNKLELALEQYQQTLANDPEFDKAKRGISRVRKMLDEQQSA